MATTKPTISDLFVSFHLALSHGNARHISDADALPFFMEAEGHIKAMAATRATVPAEIALKLRAAERENKPGGTALGLRLAQSALHDLESMSAH